MLYDYSKNIIICEDRKQVINSKIYFQIQCIHGYKDIYAKRFINKGEYGGFVHSSISKITNWIEENDILGMPITETCYIQKVSSYCKYRKSNLLNHVNFVKEYVNFCMYNKKGTSEHSKINAHLWNSQRILGMIEELKQNEEIIINQHTEISDAKKIVLWLLLGAISEAILKLHIILTREKYKDFEKSDYEKLKVKDIINKMYEQKDISKEDSIFLHKLNGNRNMIHILNNENIYNYEEYCIAIDNLFQILTDLYNIQKSMI